MSATVSSPIEIAAPSRESAGPFTAPAGSAAAGLGLSDLTELMQSVNTVTRQLQATHIQLQLQVAQLQDELAQANAQLRRTRTLAALGEMAAGIAHEVRNPLASIQLYVQMLQEDLIQQPAQAELCTKINRAVEGIESIVRDVLLFARHTRISPAPATAEELVARALSACESLVASAAVKVRVSSLAQPTRLEVDAGLITQSLSNLIRNAVEAMAEASTSRRELGITVSKQNRRGPDGRRAQRAIFSVTDTGPGVDPAIIDRMFNPFFTTRKSGTGLGLAIVHRIVDAHGGQVMVANQPGAGARIDICLPLKPEGRERGQRAEIRDRRSEVRSQTTDHRPPTTDH